MISPDDVWSPPPLRGRGREGGRRRGPRPSLLNSPQEPTGFLDGLEAQEQAFAYGVKIAGCTVHFVDEELDHGPIIVQQAIDVLDDDDEHTLAERILQREHIAYTEAINIVLQGKYKIVGRRLVTTITVM